MQCNLQRPTIKYQLSIGKTGQKNIGYWFSLKSENRYNSNSKQRFRQSCCQIQSQTVNFSGGHAPRLLNKASFAHKICTNILFLAPTLQKIKLCPWCSTMQGITYHHLVQCCIVVRKRDYWIYNAIIKQPLTVLLEYNYIKVLYCDWYWYVYIYPIPKTSLM